MIDLHLHLDGSLEPEEIILLAKESGVILPSCDASELRTILSVYPDCRDLGEYLEKFDLPLKVLQTENAIENAVYLLLKRLSVQGLCYAEIRFAPQLHLLQGLLQYQVVKAAVNGLNRGLNDFNIRAKLILCCMRLPKNSEANAETVRVAAEFLNNGICAVDLAGNEAAFPTKDYAELFKLAGSLNVPFVIHAGEAAGSESVAVALDFGAKRIGHGIHAIDDETVLEKLVLTKTPVEVCFTSNLQTKAAISSKEHPIRAFFDRGVVVTVNTDNMTVSDTTLKNEFLLLKDIYGFSEADLLRLMHNAVRAAFLEDGEKTALSRYISENFAEWLV